MSTFLLLCLILYCISLIPTKSYHLIQKSLSFRNAEYYCNTFCNSTLAIIRSSTQYNTIINQIPASLTSNIWIGLNDIANEGTFIWTDGSSSNNYTNWSISPTIDSLINCVFINKTNTGWSTASCSIQQPFICNTCLIESNNPLSNTFYPIPFLLQQQLNWDKALHIAKTTASQI